MNWFLWEMAEVQVAENYGDDCGWVLMWPNPQETGDLVTLTEEILNWKVHIYVMRISITKGFCESI